MSVVAEALGHSSTCMAEKHYAHLAPSFVADTIRRTAPDLSLPGEVVARLEARPKFGVASARQGEGENVSSSPR